jgi:hypothetical protein
VSVSATSRENARAVRLVDVDDTEIIAAIRDELFRLRTRPEDVGPLDAISAQDRGHGNAVLTGAVRRSPDFHYFGAASEILERLRSS